MNKEQKDIIIRSIQLNKYLYNSFEDYLNNQELDIGFVLFEDKSRYFDELWFSFLKESLKECRR